MTGKEDKDSSSDRQQTEDRKLDNETVEDILKDDVKEVETEVESTFEWLKKSVSDDEPQPTSSLTLSKILGGDILNAEFLKRQLWLIVLVVLFTIIYVAFRYQCQQDMIQIDKLENELKDAKYKALSSTSTLTERCRESHVLELLNNNRDSVLHIADQPPYIINVPKE